MQGLGRSRTFSAPVDDDYTYLPPEPQMGNIEYKLKLVNPTAQRLQHLVTQMKWRLREGNGEAIYEMGVEDNGIMTGLSEEDMDNSLDTLQEMARRLGATVQVILLVKNVSPRPNCSCSYSCPSSCFQVLRQRLVEGVRTVAEILVRKVPEDQTAIDLSVCVLGSADVGKSTLLGVLTQVGCLLLLLLLFRPLLLLLPLLLFLLLLLFLFLLFLLLLLLLLLLLILPLLLVVTQGELDNGRGLARLNMFRHLHEIQTGRTR